MMKASHILALTIGLALPTAGMAQSNQTKSNTKSAQASSDNYRGIVVPFRTVELSAAVEGVIRQIQTREGEQVVDEQTLVNLDDRLQKAIHLAAILQTENHTEINQRELQLKDRDIELENTNRLFTKNAAAEWEVRKAKLARDLATVELAAARKNLNQARAKLAIEKARLEMYVLRAPFKATVLKIHSRSGDSVRVGDPVMTLVEMGRLKAEFHLPSSYYGKLTKNRIYTLDAGHPISRPVFGKLSVVDPVIESASQTFRAVFEIKNNLGILPAGFSVTWNPTSKPLHQAIPPLEQPTVQRTPLPKQ